MGRTRKNIGNLEIKCDSEASADKTCCNFRGTIGDLEKHKQECPYQYVYCAFECGTKNIQKRDTTPATNGHLSTCPEYPMECKHCNEIFSRSIHIEHEPQCNEQTIPCIF